MRHLETSFSTARGLFRAIDDVSFTLNQGEILGIVGESGCGKSVTAQSIMRLLPEPWGKISGGSILFHGKDLVHLSLKEMSTIRGNRIAMIFQEPMTALNPVKTIGYQIGEMFWLHRGCSRQKGLQKATDILEKVHIPEPAKRIHNYPHQLSGGMRQRAMIAMALSCEPEILIADEPTTALDVTVQAQIIDLMIDLQRASQTAIIMITHDLGVIAEMAHRVMVMYAGQVVESAHSLPCLNLPSIPTRPVYWHRYPGWGNSDDRAKESGYRRFRALSHQWRPSLRAACSLPAAAGWWITVVMQHHSCGRSGLAISYAAGIHQAKTAITPPG